MKQEYLNVQSSIKLPEKLETALKGAVCLSYNLLEVMDSMDFCAGQPFLLEKTIAHYPTLALAESSHSLAPRVSEEWKIALASNNVLDKQDDSGNILFSVQKYISTDGKSYWTAAKGSFGITLKEYAELGTAIDEPVPNAYERSYSRVTSRYRLFIGNTEVRHFLIKSQGGKGSRAMLEKIVAELSQDDK